MAEPPDREQRWLVGSALFALALPFLAALWVFVASPGHEGSLPPAFVAPARADEAGEPSCSLPRDHAGMLTVPAGTFRPFYKGEAARLEVPSFLLDPTPVDRESFREFLRCAPRFRRASISRVFAEAGYLSDWRGELDPGGGEDEPVTHVSWFVARAYCESRGKRLPSTVEWERVFGSRVVGAAREGAAGTAFDFAMGTPAPDLGALGPAVQGVWEWTGDFNSSPVSSSQSASQFCGDGIRSTNPEDYASFLRYSFRSSLKGSYALRNLGFRCAADLAP